MCSIIGKQGKIAMQKMQNRIGLIKDKCNFQKINFLWAEFWCAPDTESAELLPGAVQANKSCETPATHTGGNMFTDKWGKFIDRLRYF